MTQASILFWINDYDYNFQSAVICQFMANSSDAQRVKWNLSSILIDQINIPVKPATSMPHLLLQGHEGAVVPEASDFAKVTDRLGKKLSFRR